MNTFLSFFQRWLGWTWWFPNPRVFVSGVYRVLIAGCESAMFPWSYLQVCQTKQSILGHSPLTFTREILISQWSYRKSKSTSRLLPRGQSQTWLVESSSFPCIQPRSECTAPAKGDDPLIIRKVSTTISISSQCWTLATRTAPSQSNPIIVRLAVLSKWR